MTLAHANEVMSRIRTLPPLANKTFPLVAPRDAAGNITAKAPYVVVQPADGDDEQIRLTGGRAGKNPRVVLHVVGSSYDNTQTVTELIKPLFIDAGGFGIQIDVDGESGRNLRWSSPLPTQVDNDVTPPLIYNTVELTWNSEPAT
jgi:hypothetical protein